MKSVATGRFWRLFDQLPADVQKLAVKNYQLWRENPHHPSLHFRGLQGGENRFTIRIGDHHRALGSLILAFANGLTDATNPGSGNLLRHRECRPA